MSAGLYMVRVCAVVFCLSALALASPGEGWGAERIELVSRALPGMVSETGASTSNYPTTGFDTGRSMVSADGRYAVFLSLSTNLVAGQVDTNSANDVFLHDRVNGTTQLVSHTGAGAGVAGNGASQSPSISADGRYVAFSSFANNLITGVGDFNNNEDVFLFDRDTGALTLISHTGISNTTPVTERSSTPMISADGNWVVFTSRGQNLMANQNSNFSTSEDIFLWQRSINKNTLVSHASTDPATDGNRTSIFSVVSSDGSRVAYVSSATNLVTGVTDTNSKTDVFLWERAANTSQLVSRASTSATTAGNSASTLPYLSADGDVLFLSDGTNHVAGQVDTNAGNDAFLFERSTGSIRLVSRSFLSATTAGSGIVAEAVLSSDGGWVAFSSPGTNYVPGQLDTNAATDVFLWYRAGGSVELVSRRAGTTVTASATPATATAGVAISPDGSRVAYVSRGTELAAGQADTFGLADLFLFDRNAGTNTLVSSAEGSATVPADGASKTPLFSADGQWLAFVSLAPNLIPGAIDSNSADDVLLHKEADGSITLVSRRAASLPSDTAPGPSTLYFIPGFGFTPTASLSADGRYAVFVSDGDRLVPGQVDRNLGSDVFHYDRQTGAITLVSRAQGTTATTGNGLSQAPALSADGRWITFYSSATNLVPGATDTNSADDVFLWDSQTGVMTLVSHIAGSLTTAGRGLSPSISSDGSWVVFNSSGTNLVSGQSDASSFSSDAFLWERATGAITLVSHGTSFLAAVGGVTDTWMSADGSFVAFLTNANNVISGQIDTSSSYDLFLWNRATGSVFLVSHSSTSTVTAVSASAAHLSADGNWLAFSSTATNVVAGLSDTNSQADLFLYDRRNGVKWPVSRSAASGSITANSASQGVMLNRDGSRLVFLSRATNLVSGVTDFNGGNDVFVYDRITGQIALASHTPASTTTAGNGAAVKVGISADGSKVVFLSAATDLVTGQTDVASTNDLFLYDVATRNVSLLSHRATSATAGLAVSAEIGALSTDGSVIGFSTPDSNVVANDHNGRYDVFLWINESGTDLEISKTDGLSSAVPGQTVTYLITVRNLGQVPVAGATVTDSFPAAFQGVSWTCAAAGGASCAASGAGSLAQGVNLPANSMVTFTVTGTVSPDATGTLVNTATVALPSGIPDLNLVNNTSTDSTTLTPQANLTSALTDAPDPVVRGGLLTYTVSVQNAGPSTAAAVTLTHTLPLGVAFVGASGTGWTCGYAASTVTCTRPSLAPGSAPAVSVQVIAPVTAGASTLTSTADVTSATPDPVATNGSITQTSVTQPSILVGPEGARTTTEAGGTAFFSVVLGSAPLAPVTVSFVSSNMEEGTVSPGSVTFTSANWISAQMVTVDGIDDAYDDGDVAYTILTSVSSSDPGYAGIDPADVPVTNQDDDTAGITVTAAEGLTTTEAGGTATFIVVLNARPRADVTIPLTVSDDEEGTVEPEALTFTTDTWNVPQTVTVTGVDDDYDDGEVESTIATGATVSTDAAWAGIDPADVTFTNEDDDTAGIEVAPTEGLVTTEGGGTATFTVVLTARPTADVTIALESSDAEEGQPSPAILTFTTDDWSTPQTVTVTGQDDDFRDGDAAYTITLHPAQSEDAAFAGIDPADVTATNRDDNYEGVFYTVTPCRLVDTRQPGHGPALQNNQVAVAQVHGVCGIPPTARAVAMNLTFTGAGQPGTVLVYPGDLTQPPVAEYLWIRAGNVSLSLSTIMKLGADGTLAIQPKLKAPKLNPTVHIVLDVTGYFE
jgi:uncharacterized repeat protein (TIGR01451 family)